MYATRFFREALGIDVKHERLGPDGGIGWPMLVEHLRGIPLESFDVVLHQVRNPLMVMQTLDTHWDQFWTKAEDAVGPLPNQRLQRHMAYWCRYNEKAEALSQMTYRVEDLYNGSGTTQRICAMIGKDSKPTSVDKEDNTRKRNRKMVILDMLREADEQLASKLVKMGIHYGYSMEEER